MMKLQPVAAARASLCVVVMCLGVLAGGATHAQEPDSTFDQKLMRLSEVLGAMHHLRNICGASEGQLWRDQMIRLLDAEAPSPARRARLVREFNKGYMTYQRSYQTCTDSASLEATKFANEGAVLSQMLAFERANY